MKIGVVGRGFVGGSIEKFISNNTVHAVISYDIKDDSNIQKSYQKIVDECSIIYLCVPTPMDIEGNCYTEVVRGSIELLSSCAKKSNRCPMVLIKSTMVPGTTEKLKQEYKNLIFVTNPEFLTERTAYQDLCNSKIHVLGLENTDKYNNPIKNVLESLHNSLWPESECVFVSNTQAEMIKYLTNSFYAYKVTFANHIYQLCQSMGVDYDGFIQAAIKSDPRLGELHWNVPGPDGSLGFGGKCFPKDFNGMIKLMEQNGVDSDILKKVWEYNLNIREEQDWNKIEGATCQRQDQ